MHLLTQHTPACPLVRFQERVFAVVGAACVGKELGLHHHTLIKKILDLFELGLKPPARGKPWTALLAYMCKNGGGKEGEYNISRLIDDMILRQNSTA